MTSPSPTPDRGGPAPLARRSSPILVLLCLGGCADRPAIIIDATRDDPTLQLSVEICAAVAGQFCATTPTAPQAMPLPQGTAKNTTTTAIFDTNATTPLRLDLFNPGHCRQLDVTIEPNGPTVHVAVQVTAAGVSVGACDPAALCAPDVSCASP